MVMSWQIHLLKKLPTMEPCTDATTNRSCQVINTSLRRHTQLTHEHIFTGNQQPAYFACEVPLSVIKHILVDGPLFWAERSNNGCLPILVMFSKTAVLAI